MSPEDVREIVRVEMRKFRSALWGVSTSNHDAQEAITAVRKALDDQFPESPAEYASDLSAYVIERVIRSHDWWDLKNIGARLGTPSVKDESFEDYGARLLLRHKDLGGRP